MAARTSKKKLEKMAEKLDFLSPKFDPLKALYSQDLQPPVPNIHIFNNLAEYAQAIKEGKIKTSEFVKPAKGKASLRQTSTRTRNLKPEFKPEEKEDVQKRLKVIAESNASSMESRKSEKKSEGRMDDSKLQEFIMAEEAFKAEQTKKKRLNVIERMEASTEGPLSILHTCLTKRLRVKVWTRKYIGLRSILAGYLVAFDKHMNLALFDVDEVYTLEERIEQSKVNDEVQRSVKKKKKKKKKANFSIEYEPPCDTLNDKTIDQNSSSLTLPYDENSRHVPGGEDETPSMEIEGSGNHQSRDTQTIIDVQVNKETTIAYKDSLVDCHTTSDNPNADLSTDIPAEESLVPSAKALSVALHVTVLPDGAADCHSPLTVDGTDVHLLTKCYSEQYEVDVATKANINMISDGIGSHSGVIEPKLTHFVYANDPNNEDISEFDISSSATNVDQIVEEGSRETQRCDIFTEENKQQSVGSDRETSCKDEGYSNKRDLDLTHSDFSKSVFVISDDSEERELSAPEGTTHSKVTESEEKGLEYVLNANRCRKTTNLSINMNNNSDVNVDECTRNEIGENTQQPASGKAIVQVSSLTDSKPVMAKVDEVVETECDFGDAKENENEGERENTGRSASSHTTVQALSLTDSKPVMPKVDEVVERDLGEAKGNENGWLRRVKSESVENVEVLQSISQVYSNSSETHSQRESRESSGDTSLERSAVQNERTTMEEVISRSAAVSLFALNVTEQVERECVDKVNVNQAQSVIDKTHLQSERTCGAALGQMTAHPGTVSRLALDAVTPLKGDNENILPACENIHPPETTHVLHAKDQPIEYEALVVAETEPSHYCGVNDNLAGEDKCFLELDKATQERLKESLQQSEKQGTLEASPSDYSGDGNRIMDPSSYTNIETASSSFPHICAEEVRPFCLSEEANSSSVCLDDTSESEVQGISNRVSNFFNITGNALEKSSVGATQVVTTASNNLDILTEENKLFHLVAPELVPIESVNTTESHSSTGTGKASNSWKVLSQGEEISAKDVLHLSGKDCVKHSTALEHNVSVSVNLQSGNVKESPGVQQLGTLQTVDGETQFRGVKVTNAYSDPKKDDVVTHSDTLTCEDRTTDLDILGDERDAIKTLEGKTDSIIGDLDNVPGKENDVRDKLGIDLFQHEANSNSKELTVESTFKSENISFNKGADGGCGRIKIEEQTKVREDNSLQNTIVETKESVGVDEREEGEISSDEEDTSEAQKDKNEKGDTKEAQTQKDEKRTLDVQKPAKEEKEEGELSSSDSDAEGLVGTSKGKVWGTSIPRTKVVEDKTVLRKEKGLFPVRRHSSSEGHLTSSKKRLRLPESSSSKRRASSFAPQNTDLRTKLSEGRKKRISIENATEGVSDTKSDGVRSGSRPVGNDVKKPAKPGNENVPCRGKDELRSTKGGHDMKPKKSKLQQTTHTQVKRREAQKLDRNSESSKEDRHAGKQSKKGKQGHTPQSSKKETGKPNGSSQGDKKMKTKSPRRHNVEDHSGINQRDGHNTVKASAVFRESDSKKRPKTSQHVAPHKTAVNENESTGKLDTVATEKKDDRKIKAKKMSKDSHATSRSNAQTSTCSESNTENSSPAVKRATMKSKTTMKLLRGKETAEPASSFVERSNKTTRKKAKLQPHPQTSGTKSATGSKQGTSGLVSPRGKAQRKPENLKTGTESINTSTVGKVDHNGKRNSKPAKTVIKVSPRIALRKDLKKSPVNMASRAKTKRGNGNEARPGNPRKRSRSVDGTETRQGKKLRLDERKDSSSKLLLASSTIKMPKSSMKTSKSNSNRENQPPCSRIKVSENMVVPVSEERLKSTDERNLLGDSKQTCGENVDSIQAKPILIGRNKCLVFKRRHVNQLFVRGDNVVMVAYAK